MVSKFHYDALSIVDAASRFVRVLAVFIVASDGFKFLSSGIALCPVAL